MLFPSLLTVLLFFAATSALAASSTSASSTTHTGTSPSASASISALTPCALTCLTLAAANSACLVATNITCACTDPNFLEKSQSCLAEECKAEDAQGAVALQKQECGTLSATAAPRSTAPFTPSNSAADISDSVSSSGSSGASAAASALATSGSSAMRATNNPAVSPAAIFAAGLLALVSGAIRVL